MVGLVMIVVKKMVLGVVMEGRVVGELRGEVDGMEMGLVLVLKLTGGGGVVLLRLSLLLHGFMSIEGRDCGRHRVVHGHLGH